MFCPYCGATLDDDALSCIACNSPVEPLKEIDVQEPASQQESAPTPEIEEDAPVVPETKKKPSKLTGILLTVFGILAVLAAVVALAIYLLPMLAGKGPETALYIKNDELFTTRLDKIQSWQITNKLVDASNSELGSQDRGYYAGLMSNYTYLTEDGRILFYPDKYNPGEEGVTIYYRNIKNPEEAPQRLDSNIAQYTISPDGQRVVYLKTDGTLFRYNMVEKVKITTDIAVGGTLPKFYTSKDCKNLIYFKTDGYTYTVYSQNEGGDSEVLASDCRQIHYINDNCTTLYYTNWKGTLYKSTRGADKKNIAYNVDTVFAVYESGEIYYTVVDYDEITQLPLNQFVEDDVKQDTTLDTLRQELANTYIRGYYANKICYYDGKTAQTLAENCVYTTETHPGTAASDAAVLAFSYCDVDKTAKVKLSEIANLTTSDVQEKIAQNMAQNSKIFVAVKGVATEITCEGKGLHAKDIHLTDDGKTAYYVAKKTVDAQTGDLYKFAIKDGKPQKSELFDTDVDTFALLDNSTVLYYCDVNSEKAIGDLYINQKLVDYDVPLLTYYYDADNQRLLYCIDVDTKDADGTLKQWKAGTTTKISDEVVTFECADDALLYITDYDADRGCGTLYIFKNGASQEVDTKVSHIISSNDTFGFVFRKIALTY